MQFVLKDTVGRVPAIERRDFKCSACPQVAHRVVFSEIVVSLDEQPVAAHTPRAIQAQAPEVPKVENAPSWVKWARTVEKVHRTQAELLKERTTRASEAIERPAEATRGWPDVA